MNDPYDLFDCRIHKTRLDCDKDEYYVCADWVREVQRRLTIYEDALGRIAGADYRGNRANESIIAESALRAGKEPDLARRDR
jgi:hypothetical protein